MNSRMSFFLLFFMVNMVYSQQPTLIHVGIANAYLDVDKVQAEFAEELHRLNPEECDFLNDTTIALDKKMAFINALGTSDSSLINQYRIYLANKYELSHSIFDSILSWRGNLPVEYKPAQQLTAHDFSCLAYLNLVCNSKYPLQSYYCAFRGVDLNPGSEAAAYIYGLVMAEHYLKVDWCKIHETMKGIQSFDGFTKDRIREVGIGQFFEEINKYASACNGGPNPPLDYLKSASMVKEKKEPCYNKPPFIQKMDGDENYAELEIISWGRPQYTPENRGTKINVTVKNSGTLSSVETNAVLSDMDISLVEAKKMKFKKNELALIEENNKRAAGEGKWIKPGIDDDEDWEQCLRVPVLQPGESFDLVFLVKDVWVINPICEIWLKLDADNNIEEKSETNNQGWLVTKNGY